MALASTSAKYQREYSTSSRQEIISLSSSVYAWKGFLVRDKYPTMLRKKADINAEGVEIGLEEILLVTTEVKR